MCVLFWFSWSLVGARLRFVPLFFARCATSGCCLRCLRSSTAPRRVRPTACLQHQERLSPASFLVAGTQPPFQSRLVFLCADKLFALPCHSLIFCKAGCSICRPDSFFLCCARLLPLLRVSQRACLPLVRFAGLLPLLLWFLPFERGDRQTSPLNSLSSRSEWLGSSVLFDLLSLSGRSTKELAFLLTLSLARILCGHSFSFQRCLLWFYCVWIFLSCSCVWILTGSPRYDSWVTRSKDSRIRGSNCFPAVIPKRAHQVFGEMSVRI
jgi:hypothetical protein